MWFLKQLSVDELLIYDEIHKLEIEEVQENATVRESQLFWLQQLLDEHSTDK